MHLDPRQEVQWFQYRMQKQKVWITPSLLGLMALMYALQSWYGVDRLPVAYRLGALVPEAVKAGELYRLLSTAFLHGSLLHIGLNSYVLWAIGRDLERILGPWRFLLLYACAAAVGGLASTAMIAGYSVGASGAIWGLMVGQGALILMNWKVIPELIRLRMRSGVMQNVMINLVYSFQAGVDWSAHLGGGLAGGLLVGSGLILWGLPRVDQDEAEDRIPDILKAAGGIAGGLLFCAPLLAIAHGRVWELFQPPELGQGELQGHTLKLPVGLSPQEQNALLLSYGDPLRDPAVVEIGANHLSEPLSPEQQEQLLTELQSELKRYGFEGTFQREGILVYGHTRRNDGTILERAARIEPDYLLKVDVLFEEAYPWQGVAEEIARSATQATPAPAP